VNACEDVGCTRLSVRGGDTLDFTSLNATGTAYELSVIKGVLEGNAYGP
jgi:hypothetical protein